jgi:hypothetical protein
MKTNEYMPAKPTLNPEYNLVLVKWGEQGYSSNPQCENCLKDLTGQHVIDAGTVWVCEGCYETYNDSECYGVPVIEDFHSDG